MRVHVEALRFDLLAVQCPDTQAKAVRFFRIAPIGIKGARDQFSQYHALQPCHAVPGFKVESDSFVRCGFNRPVSGIVLAGYALKRNAFSADDSTGTRFSSASIERAREGCEGREKNDE